MPDVDFGLCARVPPRFCPSPRSLFPPGQRFPIPLPVMTPLDQSEARTSAMWAHITTSGQESHSNTPPISTELPLLKDQFGPQSSTLHALQREIFGNDTFNLLLRTLFKELFTNKGEILSCKSVRPPPQNRKNSQAYYVRNKG